MTGRARGHTNVLHEIRFHPKDSANGITRSLPGDLVQFVLVGSRSAGAIDRRLLVPRLQLERALRNLHIFVGFA